MATRRRNARPRIPKTTGYLRGAAEAATRSRDALRAKVRPDLARDLSDVLAEIEAHPAVVDWKRRHPGVGDPMPPDEGPPAA